MKFLCMTCDAQMETVETQRQSEHGTLSIVFECPDCFGQVGMLTNAMETKLLDSLDVSVCPVGGKGRAEEAPAAAPPASAGGGGCPFGGAEAAVDDGGDALPWSPEAEERLGVIPTFAREMARRGIETFARSQGLERVTPEVLDAARASIGL